MANFIIKILEKNREHVESLKDSVVSRNGFFLNEWAYDNLGIIVALYTVFVLIFIALFAIFMLPISIVMISINACYKGFKAIRGSYYFYRKHIRESIKEYEASLNKKNTYFLCDKGDLNDWTCIVLESQLEEFLIKFFNHYNSTYDTYEMNTNECVCTRYRRRSIGDLYLICKSYFPDTNLDEVIICLIKLVNDNVIAVSKCSDIKRYVFVKKDTYTGNYQNKEVEFISGVNFEQLTAYYERNGRMS
jgi:hypothetical protein